jgi:uncharacterized pyridoxal phosphate-containing UPF0001 family protein
MAQAQRKRYQLLRAKKAEVAKPKHKTAAKRRKASAPASRKQRPVQVKPATKVPPKPKIREAASKVRKAVAKSKVQELVTPVQAAVGLAPTEATA